MRRSPNPDKGFNKYDRTPPPAKSTIELINDIEADLRKGRFGRCGQLPSQLNLRGYPPKAVEKVEFLHSRCRAKKRLWPKWMLGSPLFPLSGIIVGALVLAAFRS